MTNQKSTEGVLHKSIQGGKWLTIGTFIQRCIGFVSFFILARLFTPADFGIIAIMFLAPNILNSTMETGFGNAAVQKGGDIRQYLDPLWTIGILKSIFIAGIIYLTGPIIAKLLHAEHALLAIQLGGISIVLYHLSNIGELYFTKDLDFKKVVIRNISKDLGYAITAIAGAIYFKTYWVLVIATFVSYGAYAISTYFLHPYRPKLSFAFGRMKDLLGYSKWVVGQNWVDQIYSFLEPAIVAHSTNVKAVGLYSKGKSVASVAPGFLGPMLNIVSFPAYAKVREFPEKIKEGFMKSLDILFFVLIPVVILLQITGAKLVHIFLGDIWAGITPILKSFSIFFLLNSVVDLTYILFNALGLPKKRLKLDFIKIICTLAFMILFTGPYGILGAAIALIIGLLPSLFLSLQELTRTTTITYRNIFGTLWVPILLSTTLAIPTIIWRNEIAGLPIPLMIFLVVIAAIVYCSGTALLGIYWNVGPYNTIRVIIQHVFVRKNKIE